VGGAIDFFLGTLHLTGCTLTGNSALPPPGQTWLSLGGAIYLGNSANIGTTVTISGGTIAGNSAALGGGIYESFGNSPISLAITACSLSGTVATTSGGAIYMASNSVGNASVSMTVDGCALFGNTATVEGVGVFNNSTSGKPTVRNSTFGVDNVGKP